MNLPVVNLHSLFFVFVFVVCSFVLIRSCLFFFFCPFIPHFFFSFPLSFSFSKSIFHILSSIFFFLPFFTPERLVDLVRKISINPLGVEYKMLGEKEGFVDGMETTQVSRVMIEDERR